MSPPRQRTPRSSASRAWWLLPLLLGAALFGGPTIAPAHAATEADRLRAAILLKILAYDHNLLNRVTGDVVVAVVTDRATAARRYPLTRAFTALTRHRVQQRRIRMVSIHLEPGGLGIHRLARASGANLILLAKGARPQTIHRAVQLGTVLELPVVSADAAQVHHGVAIAIDFDGGRPRIYINLPAAKRQGLRLPAELLSLATVIR